MNIIYHRILLSAADVISVAGSEVAGHRVVVQFADYDDPQDWATVLHPALVRSRRQAEALAVRVRAVGRLDLRYWFWNQNSSHRQWFIREQPLARLETRIR